MANLCPRCGNSADPAAIHCTGCGGRYSSLNETYTVFNPIAHYLGEGSHRPVAVGDIPLSGPSAAEPVGLAGFSGPTPPISDSVDLSLDLSSGSGESDFSVDLSADLSADFSSGLSPDLSADFSSGLSPDLSADFSSDFSSDLSPDMSSNFSTDLMDIPGADSDSGLTGVDFSGLDLGGDGGQSDFTSLDFSALEGDNIA